MQNAVTKTRASIDKPLNAQEMKFIDLVVGLGREPEQAALACGYSLTTSKTIAYSWLKADGPKPYMAAEAQRRRDLASQKSGVTLAKVVGELGSIALMNPHDFCTFDAEKKRWYLDPAKFKPEHGRLVRGFTKDGTVLFHSKLEAANMLMRHLGGYTKDAPQIAIAVTLEQLILGSMSGDAPKVINGDARPAKLVNGHGKAE